MLAGGAVSVKPKCTPTMVALYVWGFTEARVCDLIESLTGQD